MVEPINDMTPSDLQCRNDKVLKPHLASNCRHLPVMLEGPRCGNNMKKVYPVHVGRQRPPLSAREVRKGRHPQLDEQPLSARTARPPCSPYPRQLGSPRPRSRLVAQLRQCRTNSIPLSSQAPLVMERDAALPEPVDARSLLVNLDCNLALCQSVPFDRPNMKSFDDILPAFSEDLSCQRGWAGSIRQDMLDAWVPQPSPCCAVASVAGAFNTIKQCDRKSDERATVREVAFLLASHCEKKAATHQEQLERLLGAAGGMLSPILTSAEALLEQHGFKWSAIRGHADEISSRDIMIALLDVLENMPSNESRGHAFRTALKALLHQVDRCSRSRSPSISKRMELAENISPKDFNAAPWQAGSRSRSQASMHYSPRDISANLPTPSSVKRCHSKQYSAMKRDLQKLLSKRCAMHRLRSERPRTTEIGSWGIAQASKDLFSSRGCEGFSVETLLGKTSSGKKAAKMPIQWHDDDAAVGRQWEGIKLAFATDQSVLVFHLRNHYALIFAWREWYDCAADGTPTFRGGNLQKMRRQILTARKGQQPSAWLEFEEVREILMSWEGYQVMHLCLTEQKASVEHVIPDADDSGDDDIYGS